jgi:hypothetical protein
MWHVAVPVAPLRAAPDDRAEAVSELLAGARVELLESGERDWVHVRNAMDGYRGWCDRKQLAEGDLDGAVPWWESLVRCERLEDGATVWMPWGTAAVPLETGLSRIGAWTFAHPDVRTARSGCPFGIAREWLGVPYRWGGKSAFGVDCSGLVQQVFASLGTALPRDAADQIHCGTPIAYSDATAGDVAFFENAQGRVVHVGILGDSSSILHAAGEVRIDRLTAEGIHRIPEGKLTHSLHGIRRFTHAI